MSKSEEIKKLSLPPQEERRLLLALETAQTIRWMGGVIFVAFVGIGLKGLSLLNDSYYEQRATTTAVEKLTERFKIVEERTTILWDRQQRAEREKHP